MIYRVFLDTNIYDGTAYSFRNDFFQTMREYAAQGNLVLLTNTVIDGEVRAHIRANVKKAIDKFNGAVENRFFALFRTLKEYSSILETQDRQKWVDVCLAEYESLLCDCKVEHISVSGVDVDKILSDYFQKKPPFEEQKPDEFKDAIAVASVVIDIDRTFAALQEETAADSTRDDITYCIVSNDKGFRDAILKNCNTAYLEEVRVFEDLKNFIDYTLMMDRQALFLKAFLLSEYGVDEMEETIKQVIENASIDIDVDFGAFAEEKDIIGIDDITYTPYILGIYEEEGKPLVAKVLLEARCTVKAWYSYTDEDNSFYDKEEGAYLWKAEIEKEGIYQVEFDVVVALEIGDCEAPEEWCVEDSKFDFSDYCIVFNDYLNTPSVIELNEDNLIEEEVVSENEPYMEYEEDGEEQREHAYSVCPDCGSPINRLNDGGNGYCINCKWNH